MRSETGSDTKHDLARHTRISMLAVIAMSGPCGAQVHFRVVTAIGCSTVYDKAASFPKIQHDAGLPRALDGYQL